MPDNERWIVVLVASLLVATLGVAMAATVTVESGSRAVTDSGLVVYPQSDISTADGQPFTSDSVTLNGVTLSGRDATARVDAFDSSGWTNLSQVQAQNGRVVVDRSDLRGVGVRGAADGLSASPITFSTTDDSAEVVASAGSDWTLIVEDTGLSQGQGVVARDTDTGNVLDAAPVQRNGTVLLDELSATNGETALNIEEGPSTLFVYNESDPTTLVDGVELTVRLFDGGTVYERTVTNGQLDLTGIPTDEPLTITVDETDSTQYVFRRITIDSAGNQQEVYLLNEANTDTAQVVFELDDRTGNFPSASTRLIVQKPITKDFDSDGSNETRYQAIVGDTFGASGDFPTILERDERYRLVVQNDQGDRRVLGSYTAQLDDRATVLIGRVEIDVDEAQGYQADLRSFTMDTDDDGTEEQFLRVLYRDDGRRTEQFEYTVTNRDTGSVVANATVDGPLGEYVRTIEVNNSTSNTTYKLDWEGSREQPDGTDKSISGTKWAGDVPEVPLPVDPRWLTLLGYVAIVAVGGLVVIIDSALGALAATGTASVLTLLGIIAIPTPALALAGAVSIAAIVGRQA
jgi:hypothetical protein